MKGVQKINKIFSFRPMALQDANNIIHWTYEAEFSIYSFSGSKDDINELMTGDYFSVFDVKNELIGYLCHGAAARVPGGITAGIYIDEEHIDIGLGLRPDLTGKKIGATFLNQGIRFLRYTLKTTKFRLVVLKFNIRAIKVYQKTGFYKCDEFYSKVKGNDELFVSMKLDWSRLEEGTR